MIRPLLALLDWFIPEARKVDPVKHRQSYLAMGIIFLVIGSGPASLLQHAWNGTWGLFGFTCLTLLVYLGLLVAYRQRDVHGAVVGVQLGFGIVAVLTVSALSGGLYSAVMPFLCVVPLLALALTDRRGGLIWTGITAATIAVAAAAEAAGVAPSVPVEPFHRPENAAVHLMMMLCYVGLVAWFVDSLDQLQRDALGRERRRADDANAAKTTFLANMSHELRTPMNGVLGLTELALNDPALPPHLRTRLQTALDSGHTLVELLNDILDLSKVESGRMVIEDIPWRPAAMATDVHRLFHEVARRRGLALHLDVDGDGVPEWVRGDPSRVRQVLCNLVGNAVKFTEEGEVRVRVRADAGQLVLSVSDTGPGISPEQKARIFEPFTQADGSTARRHGGTGLGLSISRRFAVAMAGSLEVESTLGEGATFALRLPLRASPPATEEAHSTSVAPALPRQHISGDPKKDWAGRRVLLVEDMPVNQLVAIAMLEKQGVEVVLAEDGARGLAAVLADPTFDVVLMDWHLPELDGLEATRLVRLAGHTLPIVGLTASVQPEERRHALASGMDGFVGKPFTQQELVDALAPFLDDQPARESA